MDAINAVRVCILSVERVQASAGKLFFKCTAEIVYLALR